MSTPRGGDASPGSGSGPSATAVSDAAPASVRGAAPLSSMAPFSGPFVARWDLDKTYLRTDFDTVRDLVRTAIERPDQKRTVPGAAALLRELGRAGVETHILSGSPEQLRSRLEEKLRLDGARWASLTLKPNLENLLRLRFRALRGQLGYKLPALLDKRSAMTRQRDASGQLVREVLLGDDAEADAFVYSLYADVCRGDVDMATMGAVMRNGGAYEDTIEEAKRYASNVEKGEVVERILIHLERQSSPAEFRGYGPRVVPFYNYLQAAFVLLEDGRLSPAAVLRVARDLCVKHNFDGAALARSYLDLARRGHATGAAIPEIADAFRELVARKRPAAASDLAAMVDGLVHAADDLPPPRTRTFGPLDYATLVTGHNKRRAPKR